MIHTSHLVGLLCLVSLEILFRLSFQSPSLGHVQSCPPVWPLDRHRESLAQSIFWQIHSNSNVINQLLNVVRSHLEVLIKLCSWAIAMVSMQRWKHETCHFSHLIWVVILAVIWELASRETIYRFWREMKECGNKSRKMRTRIKNQKQTERQGLKSRNKA